MYKKIYRSMCILSLIILFLSTLMILSVCYTTFNGKFKSEIKNESLFIAKLIDGSPNLEASLERASDDLSGKRISLISSDGKVIYDSRASADTLEDHNNRPEIIEARKSGFGESERYSITTSQKLYYYAVRLNNGSILRVATASKTVPSMFLGALISVLFISALVYALSVTVAKRLTANIIKPIEKIYRFDSDSFDGVYEEIQPFLKRIARQNKEINLQMSKVKSQKARLQTIIDNINEGLIIIDTNEEILSVNSCALNIFGIDEWRVKHKSFETLTRRTEIHKAVRKALSGLKDNIFFEANQRVYQIFCSPVYEKGKIIGAVMLLFDVSEKTESEKIRREFTANVSHELKTPLTTIHGYAQIIGSGIAKPDDIKGFVKKIEKESSRLITLVDDIIELSHLDETTSDPEMQNLSLRNVVTEVAENLSVKALEKNIAVSIEGDDSTVYANLCQITEMVYNLMDNAIKYNKTGGSVKVTISDNELSIADTGIGIPEKYHDRIFERFFRVDKSHSKKVNGTGLGLSIVKHLAKANNTDITFSSKLGIGTTFTIKFNRRAN